MDFHSSIEHSVSFQLRCKPELIFFISKKIPVIFFALMLDSNRCGAKFSGGDEHRSWFSVAEDNESGVV